MTKNKFFNFSPISMFSVKKWNLVFRHKFFYHRTMSFYPILTLIPYICFIFFHIFKIWKKIWTVCLFPSNLIKKTAEENFFSPIFEFFFIRLEKFKCGLQALVKNVGFFSCKQGHQDLYFDGFKIEF
jgi:hypothetical protein